MLFYIIALTTLFSAKEINFSKIRLTKINKKYLFLGLIFVLLPVMTVVVLDTFLVKTGIAETNLFFGAELRKTANLSRLEFLIEGLLKPIGSQIFITGYILNALFKKKI